ncbi:MAG: lycopene cyclase family protein [Myxococcales bacterium]|nr:lycopene cyclase family protein [Myxococcales bacterium]
MAPHDLIVLGAGPAGLSLAEACADSGMHTQCVAPDPDLRWTQRFGAWWDELDEDLQTCVDNSWAAPSVFTAADGERMLDRRYAQIETPRLQHMLRQRADASGVSFASGRAVEVSHTDTGSTVTLQDGQQLSARAVVDATGAGSFVSRPVRGAMAYQAAYGELIEVDEHPFDMGEMVYMDLRPVPGARKEDPPTFLYAMPLGKNLIFVEETSLIARLAVPQVTLQSRLARRLAAWRIEPKATHDVERCLIPMTMALPDRRQRVLGFGMAASMVHPATGYQVIRTLRRAPTVARALADALGSDQPLPRSVGSVWNHIWTRDDVRNWELYAFGARFLTTLDQPRCETFFRTFFSLPTSDWAAYLSGSPTSGQLARVMTRMFAALDPRTRWDLMRAGTSRHGAPLLRAALAK